MRENEMASEAVDDGHTACTKGYTPYPPPCQSRKVCGREAGAAATLGTSCPEMPVAERDFIGASLG